MGFQSSRVLLTAVELRVFSLIGEAGLTSQELAGRASSDPRAMDRLLKVDGKEEFTVYLASVGKRRTSDTA